MAYSGKHSGIRIPVLLECSLRSVTMEFASLFHMLIPPAQVSHIVSYTLWYLNIGQSSING